MPSPATTDSLGNHGSLFESRLNLPARRQGKVRDLYRIPATPTEPARVLMVASDRLSAFDVVLPTPIPGKGKLLSEMAAFWLRFIESTGLARTHLLSTDVADLPDQAFGQGTTPRDHLAGRITIGRLCNVIPIECVVRGYLEGSGYKDYIATGKVCGITLPANLRQCDRLPTPLYTPATKEEQGKHDENISFEEAAARVGLPLMQRLRDVSLAIYAAASAHALSRGIIIADTKFEFGIPADESGNPIGTEPIVIDEALTPDSSRFWPADTYQPGRAQASYDKQFVREYLETLVHSGAWNKQAPGPELPPAIVEGTLARYREARDRLLG